VAVRSPKHRGAYVTCGGSGIEGNEALIHPSSFLSKDFFGANEALPTLLLYHQVYKTKRVFISGLHAVEPKWVLKYGGKRIKELFEVCGLVE